MTHRDPTAADLIGKTIVAADASCVNIEHQKPVDDGMFVQIAAVHAGSHPAAPIVDIVTADGEIVQFQISDRAIVNGRVNVGWPVGRRSDGALLVEIGTQYGCLSGGRHFGARRIYVPTSSLSGIVLVRGQ